jgi:hypothetical protein
VPEHWDPPRLRAWIAARWDAKDAAAVTAWVIAEHGAGMTVAVYRGPGDTVLLLPADHCVPPDVLPCTGGVMQLVVLCRPAEGENVIPLPGLRLAGTGAAG